MRRALVVGASGAVGEAAALALLADGWAVTATMREPARDGARLAAAGAQLTRLDLEQAPDPNIARGCEAAVLTPILTLSARLAPLLAEVAQVAAFSSNNVALMPESEKYAALARAEAQLRAALPRATLIRPTLIYGDPRLPTAPRIMAWARRLPVLPLPGSGRALQQPVFHEDLARLAALAVRSAAHAGKTYAAGGPDVVSMRDLFAAIARAAGAPRPMLPVPAWALRAAAPFSAQVRALQIAELERDKLAAEVDPLPLAMQVGLEAGLAALAQRL